MAQHYTGAHAVARADLTLLTPLTVRMARIERTIRRGPTTFGRLLGLAGGSPATVKRDLSLLRQLGAVVVYDPFENGYKLHNPEWPGVMAYVVTELRKWA